MVLALDQVLRKPWSGLDHILDFKTLVEKGAPSWSEDCGSHRFCGICGSSKWFSRVFVKGYVMSAHGVVPMIRPYCKGL